MELGAIIVMIIVLLALSGVLIFLVWDYMKYKDDTNTNFTNTNQSISNEKTDRLSNMKYMVDQVNTVNTDIYNTFTSNQQIVNSNVSNLTTRQDKTIAGIGQFLRFSSNVSITPSSGTMASGNVSILDLPGFVAPDVQLIQHVTAVNGLTIRDISNSSNRNVMFCSATDSSRCIKFPDTDGNTYFTGMTAASKIVLDAESDVVGRLNFRNSTDKLQYASITSFDDALTGRKDLIVGASNTIRLIPSSGKVGISTGNMNVSAALHVVGNDPTADVFKAEYPNGNGTVSIGSDGTLNVNKIRMGGPNGVEIRADNNVLSITSPTGINIVSPSAVINSSKIVTTSQINVDSVVQPTMVSQSAVAQPTSTTV